MAIEQGTQIDTKGKTLQQLAKELGGKYNAKKKRVEYQVKGKGFKSTRYLREKDLKTGINSGAPRESLRDPVMHETTPASPTMRYGQTMGQKSTPLAQGVNTGVPSPFTAQATPFTGANQQSQTSLPNQQPSVGQTGYDQALQNLNQGGLQGNSLALAQASLKNKYQGMAQAGQASGIPAPMQGNEAKMLSSQFMPQPQGPDIGMMNMGVDQDPFMSSMMMAFQDHFNPDNQKMSLMEEYDKMSKKMGIEKLDKDLINMKNVIEGTEDDIRNEVTKAGGFATDSQVQALTDARNKTLIKNYNTLLDTRNAASSRLETMMNLSMQDRKMQDDRFTNMFNMGMQMMTYRNQMQTNAENKLMSLAALPGGFEAIQAASATSPYYKGLIDKVFGGQDGFSILTKKAQEAGAYDAEIKQLNLQKLRNDVYGTGDRNTSWQEINGKKVLVDDDTGEIIKDPSMGSTGEVQESLVTKSNLIDSLLKDKNIRSAVGPTRLARFIGRGWDSMTGGRQNFIAGVDTLASSETLDRLLSLKKEGGTLGALSEGEKATLENSATKINGWAMKDKTGKVKGYNIDEKSFKAELDRLNQLTKKALVQSGADPYSLGAVVQPDGSIWIRNSNGTLTKIN